MGWRPPHVTNRSNARHPAWRTTSPTAAAACCLYLPVGTNRDNGYSADMVSDCDQATIAALARRYGAATVWLFGSNADRRRRGRDLDLAVEGVEPARFFQFVGELMLALSQPVDVVAL